MIKRRVLSSLFIIISLSTSAICQHRGESLVIDPLVTHIDSTVKPGDDFFLFANGKWFKEHPIPPSEQSNGLWRLVQDTINAQILSLCKSSVEMMDAPQGSNKQKIGDFYYSGMDSVSLNEKGIADLKEDLAAIDRIRNVSDLIKEAAYVYTVSGSPMVSFYVGQDDMISSKNAIFVWQGGLSLPDRRFYIDTDSSAIQIRQKFVQHQTNMFKIMGLDDANAQQAAVNNMELETALAEAGRKSEATRDPFKNYSKISFKQLKESTPNIDWTLFMNGVGLKNVDTVIVGQPEFLTALNGYLTHFPIDDWKNYLKYQLVRGLAAYMDDRTYLEVFNFYSATLRGVKEPRPRWKRVVQQTNVSLGELIGQVYVSDYLPNGTKEKLLEIGSAIKAAFKERIKNLEWMSELTKEKALKKLDAITMKVGYPDKWKDLSSMTIDRSSYVRNVMSANKWRFNYMISKFGKSVDRTEWNMEPQTYNAYYNASNNEIVVPGCNIILPGFEHKLADDAILYSLIGGSVIGHEITHGFDDQGSKYDALGNLNNWWTPEDSAKFYTKTKMIVDQYNDYLVVDSLHINGELTQGENIADLGGIMIGYQAFKNTNQYKTHELIAGLTPDQRFFLGYAFEWMVNERPEDVASQIRSNVHSPVKFRTIGPLSDMWEFYRTFNVKKGDTMWRPDSLRVKIW